MPDDNLFNTPAPETQPSPEPLQVDPADGNGTPESITLEQVQELITPLQTDLSTARQELVAAQTANQNLQTRLDNFNQTPTPTPPAQTPDDFIESFTNDAKGTTEAAAARVVDARLNQLTPLLEQQHNAIHDSIVSNEQQAVEREFGPEAWKTHFEPVFQARVSDLRQSNIMALSDPKTIHNEVLGIMGLKRNELATLQASNTQATADAEAAQLQKLHDSFNTTGMTGGLTPPPVNTSKELTPAEQEFVASKKSAGETVDIQRLRTLQGQQGTSLSDWRAAQEAQK